MSFRNLSIRKKLTTLMMLISVLILLLVSGLYIAEEIYTSRTFLDREMTTVGATLGDSCKKLLMLQEIEATADILASLKVQPNIHAAYLFDEEGTPVAQYLDAAEMQFVLDILPLDFSDSASLFWADLPERKITSSWQHFGLFLPIKHEDRQVGSIYLLSDLRDLYGRLSAVSFIVLLVLGLLLFISWWLAGKLQRPVSDPLLDLVDTMGSISQGKDYTLRAEKQGRDEVGLLVDGFNRMLDQVEGHRQELIDHQQSLEGTVARRTEELRKMVSVLKLAKQQAEAASEAKSQFLANITHELRTPLIGVLGMNELMFRTAMDEQQKMLASTVQNSGEDLLTLINNVLDYSKIEAGKLQLEEAEFNLYRVVDEVLNLLAGPATEKGLSLYSQIPLAATARVLGDEVRFRQILMNLVGNAIKFTEQGSVTVALSSVMSRTKDIAFTLEVIDTGIGMDKEAQQQIFSAFYQADASHTRKYGGTGLGLAIVLQLMQLLEGELALESTVGQGSCFRVNFSLPLAAASTLALPETLQQQTVLVFTPDQICQQLLTKRLTELGLAVVAAESVADCWYRLSTAARAEKPFQLAFFSVDAVLPDGQPLYLSLREQPHPGALRRILLLKHSQALEVGKQEHKLFLPIGWDRLKESLCQSWHNLHIVDSSSPVCGVESQPPAKPKLRLLLAGGNVASRELIKLSVADLPLEIVMAGDLCQLREQAKQSRFAVTLLDTATLRFEEMSDFFARAVPDGFLIALCPTSDELGTLRSFFHGVLEKPFKRELFLPLVQPLLDGHGRSVNQATSDAGEGA